MTKQSMAVRSVVFALLLILAGLAIAQGTGRPPGNGPGTDHDILVTPGAAEGSLSFTYSGCSSRCDERPVKASSTAKLSTVTWKFRFAGEQIVMAQVNFPGGTPFFRESQNGQNGRRKHSDDHSASQRGQALGFAEIKKSMKTLNWRTNEGVIEIEDGDQFKYDVVVITVRDGNTKVYVADPIVIVRGMEDDGQ